ncbi:HIV Tat-specific factor 1 [Phytophthora pseudosyringae]|uniref:HIV Tat-specific factor 1 n=1 Tax=Phytophthora pseudosyringae TaxID=221518 RepID=A0A8T1VVE1_9STRA|nr:HIV Tat-specific factor 1 [Phytophthora pseudosyringae]
MAMAGAELWLYLDAVTGQQKGPVPAPIVKKLLRKGMLQPQQLVWTQRLSEWTEIASVEPFAAYCRVWTAVWFYMAEDPTDPSKEAERTGPVTTQQLVELFVDGQVDGMTLVWSQELDDWKPIGEVPSLKEFLQEANDDLDREAELQEQASEVPAEHQVFEKESADALVAEDGKRYVFDAESKTYVTPEDKIEDELASLQEAMVEFDAEKDEKNDEKKSGDEKNIEVAGVATAATEAKPADQSEADAEAAKKRKKKKKKKKSDKWKKTKKNTWVYVNGLPLDVTEQEVHDHFAKCGVIQADIATGEPRIKLYQNKESGGLNVGPTGDGSVCYMKEASVELAVQLLDKSQIRPEWAIDVSPAVFQQKEGDFVKRKKPKIDTRAKIKMFEKEKALSWNEGEVNEPAGLRIVVIKHMFTPAEIKDEAYEKELQEDIHDECSKIGEVSKITLFAKHVDGVVVIKFASSGSAARCVEVMNGRFFAGRKLECGFWEGTDYTHRESKNEEKQRADKFQEWLDEGSSSSESEAEEEERKTEQIEKAPEGKEVHTGREMPPLADDSDDSDVESNGDEDGENNPAAGGNEVHAGRNMPDLDDLDDDE